jgi:hypothetical protein
MALVVLELAVMAFFFCGLLCCAPATAELQRHVFAVTMLVAQSSPVQASRACLNVQKRGTEPEVFKLHKALPLIFAINQQAS